MFLLLQVIWGNIWKHMVEKKLNKCSKYNYASFVAGDLRKHLKAQWRKVKQMQPMRLCFLLGRQFEESFENAQWKSQTSEANVTPWASNLRKHLIMHSGKKPNKCNQSNYALFNAGDLRKHLKTHCGEKSNKCNRCDYTSSQTYHLRTHLITHSGKKQKFNHYDYACSDPSALRWHFKTDRYWRRAK